MHASSHVASLAGVAVAAALAVAPGEVRAAMAMCEPLLAGEVVEDRLEPQAKRLALESWVARARTYGVRYTRWGLAWGRKLACTRTAGGLHRCQAVAHPCTIKQVPPTQFIPLRRGAPPG